MEERLVAAFRWATLVVLAFASTDAFLTGGPSPSLSRAGFAAAVALFAATFWINTLGVPAMRSQPRAVVLLLAQLPACVAVPDLLFALAFEATLVLKGRSLARWVALQGAATVAILARHAPDNVTREYTHLPFDVGAGLLILATLAWQAVVVTAGILAAHALRSRRELARLNAELNATEELLSEGARSAERVRLARDVGDLLGRYLAELILHIELAAQRARPAAAAALRAGQDLSRSLLSEVREILGALRPAGGGVHVDLGAALRTLAAGMAGPQPRLHLSAPERLEVSPLAAHVAFRCVQEATTNSLRHAGAANVWIELRPVAGALELQVRDDGQGVAALRQGHGLQGMRDRVEEAGGCVRIETAPRRGFAVAVSLPLGHAPGVAEQ